MITSPVVRGHVEDTCTDDALAVELSTPPQHLSEPEHIARGRDHADPGHLRILLKKRPVRAEIGGSGVSRRKSGGEFGHDMTRLQIRAHSQRGVLQSQRYEDFL